MIKCTVCQKIYNTQVEYCDCGNDIFEEVLADMDSDIEKPVFKINAQQLLSGAIFAACLGLSGWVLFGIDSPRPSGKPVSQKAAPAVDKSKIPSIDKIWDDTPAYSVHPVDSVFAAYKSELQKALALNLYNPANQESGECEIEFKVNKTGKLIDRKMYPKFGGASFNDEVMSMVKSTAYVTPPPSGYENIQYKARVYTEKGVIKVVVK